MTAFDRAWELVKAPLDPSSIRHRKPGMGLDRVSADFVHPRDPEIRYPMEFEGDLDEHEGTVKVFDPESWRGPVGEAGITTHSDGPRATRLSEIVRMRIGDEPNEEDPETWRGFDDYEDAFGDYMDEEMDVMENYYRAFPSIDVQKPYQRLGIGTSMYDLMTALGIGVTPDVIQSQAAQEMWAKNQGKRLPADHTDEFTQVSWKPSNQEIAEWVDPTLHNMKMTDFGVKVK